ncbi:metallophosphoesterase [Nodosilinea sp. P-1105]|uniref:metallophosphoesterase n=1 Tax=Nodosilinea sp. P-1105 TaxID=2546229 RepID=UPI00146D3573|nr:metallophosphoesterase [Nodosilinea sp. P-1105]NMF81808.1 phosphodiesterase [Nodosilinea sp. P-1105]
MTLTLAQITDTHLLSDPDARLRGCPTWQTLQTVLRQVAPYQPDGLLLTGDLAERGDAIAYERLREAIAPFNRPAYWLPGNHDNVATAAQVFQADWLQGPAAHGLQSIDLGAWRLVLLNSVKSPARYGEGELSPTLLTALADTLASHPAQPTAIALHHHPVPTGIDWLDQIQVQNANDLWAILDPHPQVQLVVCGHIHLDLHHRHQRPAAAPIAVYGTPSTGLQLKHPHPTPDHHQPGFRLLSLNDDGSHHTRMVRVGEREE